MKTYIIYKEFSDHGHEVRDYLRDFKRETGKDLVEINPETKEGESLCRTYDIVEYPTLLAVDDGGVMQQMWRGTPLPQISEVSYYVGQRF